uniref:NADH-ubiquinone oxidoreductase chain 3 n=1 Tax=Paratapes undulatus TaxID=2602928 RepID=H6BHV3_9BIVA|nr:NADH dehydrogenase subunit 3 [Paratapes undulatus]AEH99644.1 NADH dehydrogenase subunit 3 [Paratapes undulatus]
MWWFGDSSSFLTCFYSVLGMFFFIFILGMALLGLAFVVSQKCRYEGGKLTSFECGFDPLSSSRTPFSLRFFLLALLFLVFDLEMILLFPYIFSVMSVYSKMSVIGKMWGLIFLAVLVLGLMHELNEGTLDWELD